MRRDQYPLYIVDDEESVLESMAFMLESYGYRVETFNLGQGFLDAIDTDQIGCVLLDSRMPGLRGQDIQKILSNQNSALSIIYLTGHGDIPMAVEALKSGAIDFFQKPVDGDSLVTAIDKAMQASESSAKGFAESKAIESLTQREREVLDLIVQGKKNQQMADELCVSLRTIEVHRSNVMKKLEADNLAVLIRKVGHLI
ncbi:Lux Regulon [Vibrio sp. B1FLJ16]|uniref:response regulator transcription factor n=1 Tax=Vibrio sp. B1FLJ16 TaxID=2751178 RepID=UPI0015F629C0|nr:response regulator [Vibrio sp. B1FLJ16]CAD7803942.1 Lux Regulon [Vibrio sp. B1FLJ16]CAE6896174.1 Lux Regulon [Vibrio sp. B1FLJ16]